MMNLKSLLIVVCFVVFLFSYSNGQNFAVDKGATCISGMASYINKSGELYEGNGGNQVSRFSISPLANHFIFKNIYFGAGGDFIHEIIGARNFDTFTVGPQIGYAYGDENTPVYPYLSIGGRYIWSEYDSHYIYSKSNGTDFFAALGVIVPIKDHIGLTFEGGYHMIKQSSKVNYDNPYIYTTDGDFDNKTGTVITLAIGIAGLLY